MKVPVLGLDGSREGSVELPKIFSTPIRPDLINRVFQNLATHRLQAQGRDPLAGEKTSAETYNPPTGRGISRIPRVKGERSPRAGQAGGVASVVKGRLPHPPRSEKIIMKSVNQKERRLAIASSVAATSSKEWVAKRGHRVEGTKDLPLVVADSIEGITKARDLRSIFQKLGITEDVMRASVRRSSSGKRRLRGRGSRHGVGPLFVVSRDEGLGKAVRSFPGVCVVPARNVSVLDLAPGGVPGRLTVWSKSSLNNLPPPILNIGEPV